MKLMKIKRQITQEMNAIDDEIKLKEKMLEIKTEIKILDEEIKELKKSKR